MEERGCRSLQRVSFRTPTSLSLGNKDAKARLDILSSPMDAMEYLSHSWSPAASDFLYTFSSNLLFPPADSCLESNANQVAKDDEQKVDMKEMIQSNNHVGNIGSLGRRAWNHSQNDKMSVNGVISLKLRMRNWLGGKHVLNFHKLYKGSRKDEHRLRAANIDAALSMTRLAAAIASVTGESDLNYGKNEGVMTCRNSMNNAVSCAATLVAAACAEAAESVGAPRDLVASAMTSGHATRMPADMITLTVKAATCLRGAAALRSRTVVGHCSRDVRVLLNSRTPVTVVSPTGKLKHRAVSIQVQPARLILMVARKYMGTILASKQYTIIDVDEEARGHWCLALLTDEGDMKLLFEDEIQLSMWTSTVSEFLQARDVGVDGGERGRRMIREEHTVETHKGLEGAGANRQTTGKVISKKEVEGGKTDCEVRSRKEGEVMRLIENRSGRRGNSLRTSDFGPWGKYTIDEDNKVNMST